MAFEVISSGPLKLNIAARQAFIKKDFLCLRKMEFSLLEYFLNNADKVLTRTQILEDVWDRNICCATNTVDVHVCSLRNKLRSYFGISPIKTVYCIGYMFSL